MSETVSIYALCDPDTDAIRYVGVTKKTLQERLEGHLIHPPSEGVREWVEELQLAGKVPSIRLLESTSPDQRYVVEQRYIERMLAQGCDLLNRNGNPAYMEAAKERRRLERIKRSREIREQGREILERPEVSSDIRIDRKQADSIKSLADRLGADPSAILREMLSFAMENMKLFE